MVDGVNGANMSDEEDSSPDRALGPTNNVPGKKKFTRNLFLNSNIIMNSALYCVPAGHGHFSQNDTLRGLTSPHQPVIPVGWWTTYTIENCMATS